MQNTKLRRIYVNSFKFSLLETFFFSNIIIIIISAWHSINQVQLCDQMLVKECNSRLIARWTWAKIFNDKTRKMMVFLTKLQIIKHRWKPNPTFLPPLKWLLFFISFLVAEQDAMEAGQNQLAEGESPPKKKSYTCSICTCKKPGHWRNHCPLQLDA